MKRNKGFTLIELMIVISVLAVLSVASTELFYRTLRATNRAESVAEVDRNAQHALLVMESFIRNARKVEAIGSGQCPGTSSTITLQAADEASVSFTLANGRIASNSAYLTAPSVTVENLQFVCTRTAGTPDIITISFDMVHTTTAQDVTTQRSYNKTINLRNIL